MFLKQAFLFLPIAVASAVFPVSRAAAEEYIAITATTATIYLEKSLRAETVGTATKGDVFELRDAGPEWYTINMFSGEWRHVRKGEARVTTHVVSPPPTESARRKLFAAFLAAEDRAQREADRRYPPTSAMMQNIDFYRLLNDRYKLEVAHQFGVTPTVYSKVAVEGAKKGWL